MEKDNALYETLLAQVTEEDYSNLIAWEELKKQGYKFHFIIDADVINKYCFPHGIDSLRFTNYKLTESYFHDEQITLFSLFYLHEAEQKIVILDEYIPEIKQMIKSATQKYITNPKKIYDELKFEEFNHKEDVFIKDHYSKVIGTILENVSGLEKIKDLLSDNKFVIDSKDFNEKDIQLIFDQERGSGDLSPIIEKYFVNQPNSKFNREDITGEPISLLNRKVDSKAIERTFEINREIMRGGSGKAKKNLYLFFGDSYIIRQLFKELFFFAPSINDKKISLYCSTQQYFAYLICKDYSNGIINHTKTISNLKSLRDKHKSITQLYDYKFNETLILNDRLFFNYRSLRNRLENIGLFKNLDLLGGKFMELFKKNNLIDFQVFFNKIIEKKDELNKTLSLEWVNILTRLEIEAERNKVFLNLIENIRNGNDSFTIARGKDVIEGTYQLLPIFINFHDSPKSSHYNDSIFLITELVLKKDVTNSAVICDKIYNLLSELGRVRFRGDFPLELKLIKALVYLVLPIETRNNYLINDEEVYEWIKEANVELEGTGSHKLHEPDVSEFYYVACWVSRRVENYSESIKFADLGIERFRKDPRFYHGKALALYCRYSKTKAFQNIDELMRVVELTEKAFYLYSLYIVEHYPYSKGMLVSEKIKECFYNNLSFFYAEIASHNKRSKQGEYYSKLSRKYLNNLKVIYRNSNIKLPEYYDTESHVEFMESYFMKDRDEILKKLSYAKSAIDKALAISSSGNQDLRYFETFKKISKRIESLKQQNEDE